MILGVANRAASDAEATILHRAGWGRLPDGFRSETVVVSRAGKPEVVTGHVEFEVPEVPSGLFLGAPLLARQANGATGAAT